MQSARPRVLAVAVLAVLAGIAGCRGGAAPEHESSARPAPASAAPAHPPAPASTGPSSPPLAEEQPLAIDRSAVERAIAQLEAQLRAPAGDPASPWALAHGLLAFGRDFQTQDGRSAVLVAASFAEPDHGANGRYGFAVEREGKPVEPHPYLLVKTFLEIGLPLDTRLRAADGSRIELRRLLADMAASVHEPATDAEWHDAAWWLSALELGPAPGGAPELPRLREAALVRLEADDSVLAVAADAQSFAPSAPMGAAKRGKTHIYGHPCGGLHFVQAVLRGAAASRERAVRVRAQRQLGLLLGRYQAERALYADTLRDHPSARLMISGQQLKFFGHLLETLALADELGVLRDDPALGEKVDDARRRVTADVLATLAQLEAEGAYARLPELAAQRPQLQLDLIGDGCHALHGLRATLKLLPAR